MIYIRKNHEPSALQKYRRQSGVSFDAMDADVKQELRESLLLEQGHLCAYCMRRIDSADTKIEHYEARNVENELVYKNLLAVCKGNEGQRYSMQTCDTHKGKQTLNINPLNVQHMQTIFYSPNGKIHSSNPCFDSDLNDILNLNCENGVLVAARKAALDKLKSIINSALKNKKDLTTVRRYFSHLQESFSEDNEYLTPYIGILRWYIEKKINSLNS